MIPVAQNSHKERRKLYAHVCWKFILPPQEGSQNEGCQIEFSLQMVYPGNPFLLSTTLGITRLL